MGERCTCTAPDGHCSKDSGNCRHGCYAICMDRPYGCRAGCTKRTAPRQSPIPLETRVSFSFKGMTVGAIVRVLSTATGIKVAVEDGVDMQIKDLTRRDSTLREALAEVAKTRGVRIEWE